MDAVDAALVNLGDDDCSTACYRQFPLPQALSDRLKSITPASPIAEIQKCDSWLGDLFADAALAVISESGIGPEQVAAIGSHGQTLLHQPLGAHPNTLQIGDPNRIAWRTGIPVVADFRRMDMAAGGHGAPFAPALHAWRFREPGSDRVVLNLGGIANITILPAESETPASGFDTGPANTLLDQWALAHKQGALDEGGRWAASGTVNQDLLQELLKDDYFSAQPPKSTGREYFNLEWLEARLSRLDARPAAADVQATLLELSCVTISRDILDYAPRTSLVLACGGGVHNPELMGRLCDLLPDTAIQTTANFGIDPDAVEAIAFAWLAKQRMEGAPGNLPAVTGARKAVLSGAIYEAGRK